MGFNFDPTNIGFKQPQYSNSNRTSNFNDKPTPITRLIHVSQVIPNKDGTGYLIGKDLRSKKQVQLRMTPESYERNQKNLLRKKEAGSVDRAQVGQGYSRWLFDENFKNAVEGKYIVARGTVPQRRKREMIDGEETVFIETSQWIDVLKEYKPNKFLAGIWTAYAFRPESANAVSSFQLWHLDDGNTHVRDRGIAIDFSAEMWEKIDREGDILESIAEKYRNIRALKERDPNAKPEYPVKRGFQIRAFKVSERKDEKGETVYVNTLANRYMPILSSTIEEIDADGNAIVRQQELTREAFENFLAEYAMLAYKSLTELPPDQYDLEPAGDNQPIIIPKDVLIEVWMFDEYPASGLSEDNKINPENPPQNKDGVRIYSMLERMTRKQTKPQVDSQPNTYYIGRGLAIDGFARLSNDGEEMIDVGDGTYRKKINAKNFVQTFYHSGWGRDLMYRLPATNGGRIIIPNELLTDEELEAKQRYSNNNTQQEEQTQADPFSEEGFV